jgi:hypothetical protein
VEQADGKPKEVQAQHSLDQAEKDETNVEISVHTRLPAFLTKNCSISSPRL